ncbi:MAG: Gfo/Idh/MocA family oxidoreductase [Spirochaetales bacterium]|uniref:Gfo/Idh/MocA family oxidoreductase n=1 Tax=Candidatus Thalassospirochaeta sargassi TaxID=3119039 RepID=A0AAJ1IFN5_9SPIO|nr:Gfo/Idh/MocA family oxidoreductase [Spirochaetales bacterium]
MIEINTDIKIAVAGCGSAGRNNIREFLKVDELEIAACCDSEAQIAEFTANEFGIPAFYTDLNDMLETEAVDALVIALPDGEHLNAALEALSRGINVFCENPLASNYAEAVEMTRAARESGLTAMINNQILEIPALQSAIKYIEKGTLGRVKYFEAAFMQNRLDAAILDDAYEEKRLIWRLSAATGSAGAIGELGSALFDITAKFCGEPAEVSATIKNIAGLDEIEEYQELELTAGDTFICQLDYTGGATGLIRGSWTAGGPHEQLALTVYGDEGMLTLDSAQSEKEFNVITSEGSAAIPADSPESSLQDKFISAVKGEAVPVSGFDAALKIQYFIEQSRLSAEGGLRLQLDAASDADL